MGVLENLNIELYADSADIHQRFKPFMIKG